MTRLLDNDKKMTQAILVMCGAADIEPTESVREQAQVMISALKVFAERNAAYKDLWREAGLDDNAHHAKSKAMRLQRAAHDMNGPFCSDDPDKPERTIEEVESEHEAQIWDRAEDDAFDLISYACFTARQVADTDPRREVAA